MNVNRKTGIVTVSLAIALVGVGITLSVVSLARRGVTIGGFRLTNDELHDGRRIQVDSPLSAHRS